MIKVKLNSDDYDAKPIDDEENLELTEDDFARGRPFKEVFRKQYAEREASGRAPVPVRRICRPPVDEPKVHIGFRLAADVVAGIRATGRGYNARVGKVLRDALAKGRFKSMALAPATARAAGQSGFSTNYDPVADVLHVRFGPEGAKFDGSKEVAPGVYVEYDAAGTAIGVEITSVRWRSEITTTALNDAA